MGEKGRWGINVSYDLFSCADVSHLPAKCPIRYSHSLILISSRHSHLILFSYVNNESDTWLAKMGASEICYNRTYT